MIKGKEQELLTKKDLSSEEETKLDHRDTVREEVIEHAKMTTEYPQHINYTEEGQKIMEEEMSIFDTSFLTSVQRKDYVNHNYTSDDTTIDKGIETIKDISKDSDNFDIDESIVQNESIQNVDYSDHTDRKESTNESRNIINDNGSTNGSNMSLGEKDEVKRKLKPDFIRKESGNVTNNGFPSKSNQDSKDGVGDNEELISFDGFENLEDILDSSMNIPDRYIIERSPDNDGQFVRYNVRVDSNSCKDVWKAYDTMRGIEVAWNVFDVEGLPIEEVKKLIHKIDKLKDLPFSHPNIIDYYYIWHKVEEKQIVVITELLMSGTLQVFAEPISLRWKIVKKWTKQVAEALAFLHSQTPEPYIHRNINLENIFMVANRREIKVGDFGLSTDVFNKFLIPPEAFVQAFTKSGNKTFVSEESDRETTTENYRETLNSRLQNIQATTKWDIYAIGMVLLQLLTKEEPYYYETNGDEELILKKISSGIPPASLLKLVTGNNQEANENDSKNDIRNKLDCILRIRNESENPNYHKVIDFINLCLKSNPEERPSIQTLLSHSFLISDNGELDLCEVELSPLHESYNYSSKSNVVDAEQPPKVDTDKSELIIQSNDQTTEIPSTKISSTEESDENFQKPDIQKESYLNFQENSSHVSTGSTVMLKSSSLSDFSDSDIGESNQKERKEGEVKLDSNSNNLLQENLPFPKKTLPGDILVNDSPNLPTLEASESSFMSSQVNLSSSDPFYGYNRFSSDVSGDYQPLLGSTTTTDSFTQQVPALQIHLPEANGEDIFLDNEEYQCNDELVSQMEKDDFENRQIGNSVHQQTTGGYHELSPLPQLNSDPVVDKIEDQITSQVSRDYSSGSSVSLLSSPELVPSTSPRLETSESNDTYQTEKTASQELSPDLKKSLSGSNMEVQGHKHEKYTTDDCNFKTYNVSQTCTDAPIFNVVLADSDESNGIFDAIIARRKPSSLRNSIEGNSEDNDAFEEICNNTIQGQSAPIPIPVLVDVNNTHDSGEQKRSFSNGLYGSPLSNQRISEGFCKMKLEMKQNPNQNKMIEFEYNLYHDNSEEVAKEMCTELQISLSHLNAIADQIEKMKMKEMAKKRVWTFNEDHRDGSLHGELVLASSDKEKKNKHVENGARNMVNETNSSAFLDPLHEQKLEVANNDWDSENLKQYLEEISDTDADKVKERKTKFNNKIQKVHRENQVQLRTLEEKRDELRQDFDTYCKKYDKKMTDFNRKFESEETTQTLRLLKIEETWEQQIKDYIVQQQQQAHTEGLSNES